jgi:hypothetical protein
LHAVDHLPLHRRRLRRSRRRSAPRIASNGNEP